MQHIRVKNVEQLIDRDRNTILRWEREGLIPHPQKDSRGWRFYTEKDIETIKIFMKKLKKQREVFYGSIGKNNNLQATIRGNNIIESVV